MIFPKSRRVCHIEGSPPAQKSLYYLLFYFILQANWRKYSEFYLFFMSVSFVLCAGSYKLNKKSNKHYKYAVKENICNQSSDVHSFVSIIYFKFKQRWV